MMHLLHNYTVMDDTPYARVSEPDCQVEKSYTPQVT